MTVEQMRDESSDRFPVGMRVLAVDDDPICLKLLETLLRKCQYHVTTTKQAIVALKMLRENKNMFDLVISDVHMPDMDGFKLLELVGLEMDLPVIMLSANGDNKLVMKGITHGACDYLVKPVRMEELKNIWQHVLRRKKPDPRDRNSSSTKDKNSGEQNGNSDHDSKLSKKRKDQNSDDEDDEQDENKHDDDPSAQKKPRVVWSMELHRKFVAAVNQLGLDNAVPKKILDLMNVEKLTRENVASHLQKYRLYLKRISSMNNQQANMVAALGGPDSSYLQMNCVNFHNFNNSSQFQKNTLRPLPSAAVYGRLSTPVGLGLHGLNPLGHSQIPRSSSCQKFYPGLLSGDQTGTVLQGMPTSLEFDQLQPKNENAQLFSASTNNSLLSLPNSSMTMPYDRKTHEVYGINLDTPPNSLDHNRCNGNWPSAVQSQPSVPRLDTQSQADNNGYAPKQVWDDPKLVLLDGSANSLMGTHQGSYPIGDPRSRNIVLNRNVGFSSLGDPIYDSLATQHNQQLIGSSGVDLAEGRNLGSFVGDAGSLEDVVTSVLRREQDEAASNNGDIGCDLYSLRSCI